MASVSFMAIDDSHKTFDEFVSIDLWRIKIGIRKRRRFMVSVIRLLIYHSNAQTPVTDSNENAQTTSNNII